MLQEKQFWAGPPASGGEHLPPGRIPEGQVGGVRRKGNTDIHSIDTRLLTRVDWRVEGHMRSAGCWLAGGPAALQPLQ